MGAAIVLSKAEARARAYRNLREARAARFPFPIEGRIPNFAGAEVAARHVRELEAYRSARAVKANPDAPQLPLRAMALADGKTVYIPTPRLRGAFLRIAPSDVPAGEERSAVSLSARGRYGREVSLRELAAGGVDLVVAGSVAVSADGARAGKGEGYADLEYAVLRELGHPDVPVVTTVHPAQLVAGIVVEPHDISVDYIATPAGVRATRTPYLKPGGIDWARLPAEALAAMPVLAELRRETAERIADGAADWERRHVPDVLAPGLRVVFAGLNPGRRSAETGHHFAGATNHFWRLLHDAGFTPRRLAPSEDGQLPGLGLGVTNIVARPTRGEPDLSWAELVAGGDELRRRIGRCRPDLLALLGKQVYRAYAGLSRTAAVSWGWQDARTVPGVRAYVAPNPSTRSTVPYAVRLDCFREIRAALDGLPARRRGPARR